MNTNRNTTKYYRYHHQGDKHHNRITCTNCLPHFIRARAEAAPRLRIHKFGKQSWHKLPPAYLAQLFAGNPDRIICDHCRNDDKVTI